MTDLGFDGLLVRGAGAAIGVGALWLCAVVLAAVAEATSSGRFAVAHRLGCPAALRAWLVAVVSVLLLGNQPATARGGIEPPARAVDGLAVPTRTTDPAPRPHTPTASVTVRTGDSLWKIARRALHVPGSVRPGDADVAAAVRSLYAANRSAIGADPDLLEPGQVLRIPHDFPTRITYSEER